MKNPQWLLLLVLPLAACSKSPNQFLIGATNTVCMSHKEAADGREVKLNHSDTSFTYPKSILIEEWQADLDFKPKFESGEFSRLAPEFGVGYGAGGLEKPSNRYCVGQYDFDKNGIPELIIAVKDSDLGENTGISLSIFQYNPAKNPNDAADNDNWRIIGTLTAADAVGDTQIILKDNSVKIPRNSQGLYYEISWINGRFASTSGREKSPEEPVEPNKPTLNKSSNNKPSERSLIQANWNNIQRDIREYYFKQGYRANVSLHLGSDNVLRGTALVEPMINNGSGTVRQDCVAYINRQGGYQWQCQ